MDNKLFKNNEEKGQTLMEVVLALGVAVFALLALVGVTVSSINNSVASRNQSQATKYLQDSVEKIRLYRDQTDVGWDDFTGACVSATILLDSPPSPPFNSPPPANPSYTCFVPGTTSNCSVADDQCEVRVEILWTDTKGGHQADIQTILTNWQ